jgi:hypothetical protein
MIQRAHKRKKLLVATLGVAAVSFVGCRSATQTTGNLVPPPPQDSGTPPRDAASSTPELAAPDAGSK